MTMELEVNFMVYYRIYEYLPFGRRLKSNLDTVLVHCRSQFYKIKVWNQINFCPYQFAIENKPIQKQNEINRPKTN